MGSVVDGDHGARVRQWWPAAPSSSGLPINSSNKSSYRFPCDRLTVRYLSSQGSPLCSCPLFFSTLGSAYLSSWTCVVLSSFSFTYRFFVHRVTRAFWEPIPCFHFACISARLSWLACTRQLPVPISEIESISDEFMYNTNLTRVNNKDSL